MTPLQSCKPSIAAVYRTAIVMTATIMNIIHYDFIHTEITIVNVSLCVGILVISSTIHTYIYIYIYMKPARGPQTMIFSD